MSRYLELTVPTTKSLGKGIDLDSIESWEYSGNSADTHQSRIDIVCKSGREKRYYNETADLLYDILHATSTTLKPY